MILVLMLAPIMLVGQINWTRDTVDVVFGSGYAVRGIDLDGDNDNDVLASSWNDNVIIWWENDGNENFTRDTIAIDLPGAYSTFMIDVDGDTDIDIVSGNGNPPRSVVWCENDGDENFTKHTISVRGGIPTVYAVDLDDDDDIDILSGENGLFWYRNDGDENFSEDTIRVDLNGVRGIYVIDLDGDNDKDVLAAARFADSLVWFENDGNENFTQHVIKADWNGNSAVFAVDLDGDDDVDVVSTAINANDIIWFENDGDENFTEHVIDGYFIGAGEIYVIDMDKDDDLDIVVAGSDQHAWFENDGNQGFTLYTIGTDNGSSCFPIDLDDDTDIDLLVLSSASGVYWWRSDLVVTYDIALVSIDIDSLVPQGTALNPMATVKNLGNNTETFDVTCTISPGGYSETEVVTDLVAGDSIQVVFSSEFTFSPGVYTVTVYTELVGDENPENDTLMKTVETYDPGVAEGISSIPQSFSFGAPTITKKRTEINLALPQTTRINLGIYDVLGRLTETVISSTLSAGNHRIDINLDIPAGVYFYKLTTTSGENVIKKFLIVE